MSEITDSLISTRTIIAKIPLQFKTEEIFDNLPINCRLKGYDCEILLLYYKNKIKGDVTLKKNNSTFRNAVNVIINSSNKLINLKISKNGNFQITGCKEEINVYKAVEYLIMLIKKHCPHIVEKWETPIDILFKTVMTNIVFSVGYAIDKKKLNNLLKDDKSFYNLFETSFGYTGMNIKLPLNESAFQYGSINSSFDENENKWMHSTKLIKNTFDKPKYNTFLVFHSGKVIMSGICEENMKKDYQLFRSFLETNKDKIIETIM